MMRKSKGFCFLIALVCVLAGCQNEQKFGIVSGTVTDVEGDPVANAEVFVLRQPNARTRTLHNGTYYLTNVPEGFTVIQARAVINGVEYTGQQVAQVFEKEQSKSVNLMIAHTNRQGSIAGFVQDASGRPLERARVFVAGALSSALAITDRRGNYRIDGLPGGYDYLVVASAPGFENVKQMVSVRAGEVRPVSFTLNPSSNRPVNTPLNLRATTWTMPQELIATRNPALRRAYESIQALLEPNRPQLPDRYKTPPPQRAHGDYWIEVDLQWDYEEQQSLLGYGIYRGRTLEELDKNAVAFLRDPLASFFADLDPALQPNVSYYYEIVAINTDYLNDLPNTVSGRSNRVSARPFVPIALLEPRPNDLVDRLGLILRWTPVERADAYLVLIYDRFPDYQVSPYYPSDLSDPGPARVPAPNTSLVYTGPALIPGRTYYAVVIAFTNDRTTRAISQIVPFQVR